MSRNNHKSRNRSPSPSSSSESCSEETEVKIIEKCKTYKKHEKHHSDNSDTEDCRKKKHHKKPEKCNESDEEKKCFDDVYKYFKQRLINDECLMVNGSTCYGNMVNNTSLTIPVTYAAEYSNLLVNNNIEYGYFGAPVFVRESGIYVVFFAALNDQASQFTIFVNGIPDIITTVGSNAGGGQLVSRHLLKLKKDDNVIVRNYLSTMSSLSCNGYAGGLVNGNDLTLLLMKIGPLEAPEYECKDFSLYEKCLSKNKRCLFKKLLDKMLCDKDLMLKGFNIRGTFSTKFTQVVPTEGDVAFDSYNNVNGLTWNPTGSNPEQIKIMEDGVYKVFALIGTITSAQYAIAVNGVPYDGSINGMNHGAGQLTIRTILELKKNDILTLRNHTSANGSSVLSQNQGGSELSISAIVTIFKLSPLCKQPIKNCDYECSEYYKNCYDKFRNYLLCNDKLQVAGSPAYCSLTSTSHQVIPVEGSFYWNNDASKLNIVHQPGNRNVTIEREGLYDVFVDITTNEPMQFALFVNGVVDLSSIFGKDSGGTKGLIRQFVKLNKGDVVSIRNYKSGQGNVTTAVNPGGSLVGQTALLLVFMLSPCHDHDKVHCENECKKK
jgi:hypothetical protein